MTSAAAPPFFFAGFQLRQKTDAVYPLAKTSIREFSGPMEKSSEGCGGLRSAVGGNSASVDGLSGGKRISNVAVASGPGEVRSMVWRVIGDRRCLRSMRFIVRCITSCYSFCYTAGTKGRGGSSSAIGVKFVEPSTAQKLFSNVPALGGGDPL